MEEFFSWRTTDRELKLLLTAPVLYEVASTSVCHLPSCSESGVVGSWTLVMLSFLCQHRDSNSNFQRSGWIRSTFTVNSQFVSLWLDTPDKSTSGPCPSRKEEIDNFRSKKDGSQGAETISYALLVAILLDCHCTATRSMPCVGSRETHWCSLQSTAVCYRNRWKDSVLLPTP